MDVWDVPGTAREGMAREREEVARGVYFGTQSRKMEAVGASRHTLFRGPRRSNSRFRRPLPVPLNNAHFCSPFILQPSLLCRVLIGIELSR